MAQLPKFLQSSANAQALSLSVKGVLLGLVPIVLIVLKGFDPAGEVVADDLQNIANTVGDVIIAVFGLVSPFVTLYGLVRKVANTLKPKKDFNDLGNKNNNDAGDK